jgi:hypothetical protein
MAERLKVGVAFCVRGAGSRTWTRSWRPSQQPAAAAAAAAVVVVAGQVWWPWR